MIEVLEKTFNVGYKKNCKTRFIMKYKEDSYP
jgi:hypothetical protein